MAGRIFRRAFRSRTHAMAEEPARHDAEEAPISGEQPKEEKPKVTAKKETQKQEKRKRAHERIGRTMCWHLAGVLYRACSIILGDERWLLDQPEQQSIAGAYLQFAEAFEIDFSGKIATVAAVITVNADALAARADLLMAKPAETRGTKPVEWQPT